MPIITVKYLVNLREKAGTGREELDFSENARLQDVAERIRKLHGIDLHDPRIMATLNGKGWSQYPEGINTRVKEADVVLLFPPLSGG